MHLRNLGGACLALFVLLGVPHGAHAEEFYYLLMFGAQRDAMQPQYAHTFATFVKATGQGPCLANYHLETHTISWLPATLNIRLFARRAECGRNVGLDDTIHWALSNGERVSFWGPYRITPGLYCRALRQCALLDSGHVRYKAIDSFHAADRVSNCIHAVSSVVDGYRLRVLSPEWGETASWYVLRRMEPYIIDVCQVYPCIATKLGLDQYPLVHRCYENPRTGLGWRTIKTLGGQR